MQNILVVEDDIDIQEILNNYLTDAGYKVIIAYGYKFNEERMQKQMILLPTAANGQPDYDYMEQYAKKLFSSLRLQYLHEKVTVAI